MELSNDFVSHKATHEALRELSSHQFPAKEAYNISRICNQVKKEFGNLNAEFQKFRDEFAILNEKGQFTFDDAKPWGFKVSEDKEALAAEKFATFMNKKIVLEKVHKIPFELIIDIQISPIHLEALEPLFDGLE